MLRAIPEAAPWIVAGRYEVGEIVGRGGYGMARRAIDRKTGQPVAMKVLAADAGKDPHLVERIHVETSRVASAPLGW
jgi:eukaryotic-like serine/threonine-protein kinase